MKKAMFNIAVSVNDDGDLTKVSVRVGSLEKMLTLEPYNVVFETNAFTDADYLFPADSNDYFQIIDDKLDPETYFTLKSRKYAIRGLSDYLDKILDSIDSFLKRDYEIEYYLIFDNTLGLKRLSDSVAFVSDALECFPNRQRMFHPLTMPKTLIVLDWLDFNVNINNPIVCTEEMIRVSRNKIHNLA